MEVPKQLQKQEGSEEVIVEEEVNTSQRKKKNGHWKFLGQIQRQFN
jgi:hypothetical protein